MKCSRGYHITKQEQKKKIDIANIFLTPSFPGFKKFTVYFVIFMNFFFAKFFYLKTRQKHKIIKREEKEEE